MRADLHIHSHYSPDAIGTPAGICRAAVRKDLGALALTDHDTSAGWDAMAVATAQAGLLFIRGQERKVVENSRVSGEVLCLFIRDPIRSHDLAGIAAEVREQDGLLVAAHPFDRRRQAFDRLDERMGDCGTLAVEALNGRTYRADANKQASDYAAALALPVTAGSDAHTPSEVGNVYVEAEARTVEELKRAILNREVRVYGRASSPIYSMVSGMRKLGFGGPIEPCTTDILAQPFVRDHPPPFARSAACCEEGGD